MDSVPPSMARHAGTELNADLGGITIVESNLPRLAGKDVVSKGDTLFVLPGGYQVFYGATDKDTAQAMEYFKEVVTRRTNTDKLAPGLETFAIDCELNKQRVVLDYYVLRQARGGATVAARLAPAELISLRKDMDRILKSVQLR